MARSIATTKASYVPGSITSPSDRQPIGRSTVFPTFSDPVPGVFVAGDVRKGSVKRLTVAAGEGAMAIDEIHRYLGETFT